MVGIKADPARCAADLTRVKEPARVRGLERCNGLVVVYLSG
jgi:hypothetical protein